MKKILCPTDFSKAALNAIAYAAEFSKVHDADLILFYAQPAFEFVSKEFNGTTVTLETASEQLAVLSREVTKTYSISCSPHIEPIAGSLSTAIGSMSEEYDLVIMGTNGTDELIQYFTGSNAYQAIVKSSIPFLIVPEDYEYREIENVTYAFDYFRKRKLPLTQLLPWVKTYSNELTIVQILERDLSTQPQTDIQEYQGALTQKYKSEIILKFDNIRSNEIAESINDYVLQHDFDALAICTIERNFMEGLFHKSVIKQIVSVASYPVFVLHER